MSVTTNNPTMSPGTTPLLTPEEAKVLADKNITVKTSETMPNTGIISYGGRTFHVKLSNTDLALNASDLEHLAGKVAVMLATKGVLTSSFEGARINKSGIETLKDHKVIPFEQQNDPAQKMYQELTHFIGQRTLSESPKPLSEPPKPIEQKKTIEEKPVSSSLSTAAPNQPKTLVDGLQMTFFKNVGLAYEQFRRNIDKANQNSDPKAAQAALEKEIGWIDKKLGDLKNAAKFPGLVDPESKADNGTESLANAWTKELTSLKEHVNRQIAEYKKLAEGSPTDSATTKTEAKPVQTTQATQETEKAQSTQETEKAQSKESSVEKTEKKVIQQTDSKPLSETDKNLYRQSFESLVIRTKQLAKGNALRKQKLVMEGGKPDLADRKGGLLKSRKGTSARAQQTAKEVISLLRTNFNQGLFSKEDVATLKTLNENLSIQLAATLSNNPTLKASFDKVFQDIDQAKEGFVKQETYAERIESALAENGKPVTVESAIEFLLKPDQTQLRKDFLAGGGWMDFIRKDEGGKNAGILAKAMTDVFKKHAEIEKSTGNQLYSLKKEVVDEKKAILDFATDLVKRGIVKKDDLAELIKLAKSDKNLTIQGTMTGRYAARLANAEPMTVPKSTEAIAKMEVENKTVNLSSQFERLASNKLGAKQRSFFIKSLMADLHHVSAATFKTAQPTEFYGQAWNKGTVEDKQSKAPNLTASIAFFNQVSKFVGSQILMNPTYTPAQRVKIYEAFVEMAEGFVTTHSPKDYNMAYAIMSGLNATAVFNTMKNEPVSEKAKATKARIDELLSTNGNSRLLREEYKQNQLDNIPYVPNIGLHLTDLTFIDDGNPEMRKTPQGESLNLKKLKFVGNKQGEIEAEIKQLNEGPQLGSTLHYDVNQQILQAKLPTETELEARKEALYPRKKS